MSADGRGRRRIDRVLDPEYVTGLTDLSLAELRGRVKESEDVEGEVSLLRRMLHGHVEIARAELERRNSGTSEELPGKLSEILSTDEPPSRRGARTRMPRDVPLGDRRDLDRLLSDGHLARLPEMTDEQLRDLVESVEDAEREISSRRKLVQGVVDELKNEIGRRYKAGTASPDDVLGH